MYYQVEIVRDENGDVIERRLVMKSPQLTRLRNGKEIEVVEAEDCDMELSKVSVDEDGKLFLEEDTDKIAAKAAEEDIALRIKRIQFGQRLIAIMSIRNDAKDLTPAEIVELVATFQTVNTAWLNGSIATSRAIIDAITPDGELLTAADKTAMLAEIDANWAQLGYEPL